MNSLRNNVRLIGNLGADPEMKEIQSGKQMAKLSLATNESYKKSDGEQVEETQWHNLVLWGKTAEIAGKYLTKGQEICVDGKLTTRSWEDAEGKKRYMTEVIVNDFLMLGKKN
ncbi:MAG: single-strand DNA-binding protein [Bacteroidia bacterium]|jgi:single-strand DNA-binding protein